MQLNPKQKQSIRDSTARLNIWEGSVRSGKSVGIDYRILKALGEPKKGLPPDAIDVFIGKTLSSLKRNVLNPIIELVGQDNAQYFSGKQEFHLWGNACYTIGANDERSEGKIRGSTIRKCLGDELTLWPESFFKMLDSRMSLEQSQFFGSTNPGPPKHYLKVDYIDRQHELNLKTFKFKLDDNKALLRDSPSYVEAIKKNYTGLWYKRFILGEWCMAEGSIYDFFDAAIHTVDETPEAEYHIIGGDYGTSNPTAFILFGVNRNAKPKIWAEQEYYFDSKKAQRQKTDAEYSSDFQMFCKEHLGKYWQNVLKRAYFDPSAESMQLQLRRDGVHSLCDANNEVLPGIATVATMLKTGDFAIHKRCKNYIDEFYAYAWDPKAQAKGLDLPLKTNDHCQDAGRYAIYSEFGDEYVDISILSRM
jgi:PBSX family phage terminase large subunit